MMNYFKLTYSVIFIFYLSACADQNEEAREAAVAQAIEDSKPIDPMVGKVAKRLNYFDQKFFRDDSTLFLTAAEREALSPVIREKLEALEAAKLRGIEDREARKSVRDSIRKSWHGRIDAELRPGQVEARHAVVKDFREE